MVVYGPIRRHAFLVYDDYQYVTENPPVRGGLTWRGAAERYPTARAAARDNVRATSVSPSLQGNDGDAGSFSLLSLRAREIARAIAERKTSRPASEVAHA